MPTARQRIQRELRKFKSDPQSVIQLKTVDDSMMNLCAEIAGPRGSPYEGGTFEVKIFVPKKYPFSPPDIHFATKIWHPNVRCSDGSIRFFKQQWTAVWNLRYLMTTVLALMSEPQLSAPTDYVVARQFDQNYTTYVKTARHWTNAYAGGRRSVPPYDKMVRQLKQREVEENLARVMLSVENWDISKVLRFL